MADELEALRAALREREREIYALTQGYHVVVSPGHVAGVTGPQTPGMAALPGVYTTGPTESQGEIHHHHHFQKSGKGSNTE